MLSLTENVWVWLSENLKKEVNQGRKELPSAASISI